MNLRRSGCAQSERICSKISSQTLQFRYVRRRRRVDSCSYQSMIVNSSSKRKAASESGKRTTSLKHNLTQRSLRWRRQLEDARDSRPFHNTARSRSLGSSATIDGCIIYTRRGIPHASATISVQKHECQPQGSNDYPKGRGNGRRVQVSAQSDRPHQTPDL